MSERGAASTYITAEMRAAVGRELESRVSFPISASDVRRWALAVYYPEEPPSRYWDVADAVAVAQGGIVVPDDFNPFAWMTAQSKGPLRPTHLNFAHPERQLGIQEPDLPSGLNGGLEVEYGVRMRLGDVITSARRLHGYSERTGTVGRMLFTTSEDTWTNQRGERVQTRRTTVIRY